MVNERITSDDANAVVAGVDALVALLQKDITAWRATLAQGDSAAAAEHLARAVQTADALSRVLVLIQRAARTA